MHLGTYVNSMVYLQDTDCWGRTLRPHPEQRRWLPRATEGRRFA